MRIPNMPIDDKKFLRLPQDDSALFEYKEHSRALKNANAFEMALHIHQNAELLVVTSGEISVQVSGKTKEIIHSGEAALIFPFQPHSYSRERGTEYFRFSFSTFLAKSFFMTNESKVGERAVFRPDKDDTYPFLNKLQRKERPSLYKIKSFVYSMISDYLSQVPLTSKSADDHVLTRVVAYMEKNKKEQIAMSDVALSLGYNEKYLSRCLSKASNLSFSSLLATLRMDEARTMLMETDKTILEIAIECGFGSERSFYRHFKALMGISPKTYRKSNNRPARVDNDILI